MKHSTKHRPMSIRSLLRTLPDTDLARLSRAAQQNVAAQTGIVSGALGALSTTRTRCAWVTGYSERSN